MQQQTIKNIEIPDHINPIYLFSTTATDLLVQIATGEIDPKELAVRELLNRGLDPNTGLWIGFN